MLVVGLSVLGCGKSFDEVMATEKAAMDGRRAQLKAVVGTARLGGDEACELPADVAGAGLTEVAYLENVRLEGGDAPNDNFSLKLDPHKSDLTMALAWTAPGRPPMKKPFPYSLIPDPARPETKETFTKAKAVKYFVVTRVVEQRDSEGVVVGEAQLFELESGKRLCSVRAEGKADPGALGEEHRLVRRNTKTGQETTLRTDVRNDYADQVSSALKYALRDAMRAKFKMPALEL